MALKTSIVIGAVFQGAQAFASSQKATSLLGRTLEKLNQKKTKLNVNDKDFDRTQKKIALVNSALDKIEKRKVKIGDLKTSQQEFHSNLMGKVAAAGAIIAPVKIAMDFEQSMTNVGAVANASDEELKALTAKARELGATTSWSASQTADGMKYLAMAGFDTNQTIAAMPGLLNLASAGATDLGSASDIASDILSGFGMKAENMGQLGDVLANTFTSSNTTLSGLGDTMKYVAPTARSAGMSIEQVAAMAGKLGDEGVKGSMAGTALNAIIGRLAAPTGEAAKKLKELGIETKDSAGNLKELPALLAEIEQTTTGMGSAEKLEFMNAVYGMEAASKAQILQTQAASGALQEYEQTLLEQGSAQRIAEQQNATAAGAMKRLGSAIESISITIGNVLLPMVASGAEFFAGLLGTVGSFAEAFPSLTTVVVGATLGLGGMAIAISAGGYAFSFIYMGMLKARSILTATSTAVKLLSINLRLGAVAKKAYTLTTTVLTGALRLMGGALRWAGRGAVWLGKALAVGVLKAYSLGVTVLTGALRLMGGALRLVGKSILWVGRALLMNPIGLAITGIALAAYAVYKYWEPIKGFFSGLWTQIKTAFDGGLTGIGALILNWSPLGLFYKAFSGVLGWLGVELPETFTGFGGQMISSLTDGAIGLFSGAWTQVKTAFDGGLTGVGALILNWSPLGLFYKAFSGVLSWFDVELPETFTGFGGKMIGALMDGIQMLLPDVSGMLNSIPMPDWVKSKLGLKTDEFQTALDVNPEINPQAASAKKLLPDVGNLFSNISMPDWAKNVLGFAPTEMPSQGLDVKYIQPEPKRVQAALRGQPQMQNNIEVTVNNPASTVEVEQAITNAMGRQFAVPLTDMDY